MADQNKYWLGTAKATIFYIDDVAADWGKGPKSANRLRMLNGAFEIYYILKNSINECPDSNHKELMTKELEDAGTKGWGFGVQDLDHAFQHWMQPGKWTDNHLDSYYHNTRGVFGSVSPAIEGATFVWGEANLIMEGPTAAVNFFNSLDDKLEDLKSNISKHNEAVKNLGDAIRTKNSRKTKDTLTTVAKIGSYAKKLLFLAPKPNETFLQDVLSGRSPISGGSFDRFSDLNPGKLTDSSVPVSPSSPSSGAGIIAAKGAGTFLGALSDLDTFLSVHKAALDSGIFDNQTATAFGALAVACGKVPVLGSFYAAIIKKLPGFFAAEKELFAEHYRVIDRAMNAH